MYTESGCIFARTASTIGSRADEGVDCMEEKTSEERPERVPKRAYSAPALVVYGDLNRITHAVAMNSTTMDGGVGQTNKTA